MAPSYASRPPNPNFALARSLLDRIYIAPSKPSSAPRPSNIEDPFPRRTAAISLPQPGLQALAQVIVDAGAGSAISKALVPPAPLPPVFFRSPARPALSKIQNISTLAGVAGQLRT